MRQNPTEKFTYLILALSWLLVAAPVAIVRAEPYNTGPSAENAAVDVEEAPQEYADSEEPRSLEETPLEPAPLEEPPGALEEPPRALEEEVSPEDEAPADLPQAEEASPPAPVDPYADEPLPAEEPPVEASPVHPNPTVIKSASAPAAATPAAPSAENKPAEPATKDPQAPATRSLALDPASLDGVRPGTTSRKELHEKWGEPQRSQRIAGGSREFYDLPKLGRVQATIFEDVVESLTIQITRPLPVPEVAKRLSIDDVTPVAIQDEQGEVLGAAYPERGVLLGYMPGSRPLQVFQVVIEAISPQPFLARAEVRMAHQYGEALADVEQALVLEPNHPQAHHLHGELMLLSGKLDQALKSAQHAASLEPQAAEHRLLVARVLAASGDYPLAITRVRGILEEPGLSELDAAQAQCQWGDYIAYSHLGDYPEAIKHHQQAIAHAEALLSGQDRATTRAAKEVLLDAHLGVAYDIGHGRWQQKTAAVAKWIDRAAVFADDLVRSEKAGSEMRLRVYCGTLAAITGIPDPPNVAKWIAGARELGQKTFEQNEDPAFRGQLAWQLARAMSDAVEIEATRGNADDAFSCGSLARSLFEESKNVAGQFPTYPYECGLLCYRMGVTCAVQREDHAQAVVWFDRATPLLESPVPQAAIDRGIQGEAFVSMAVSYWEQANRPEALRLTTQGLKLMEHAVEDGSLLPAALAIPYGNLSAMHEELGDNEQAKWCADLATRYENTSKK